MNEKGQLALGMPGRIGWIAITVLGALGILVFLYVPLTERVCWSYMERHVNQVTWFAKVFGAECGVVSSLGSWGYSVLFICFNFVAVFLLAMPGVWVLVDKG